MRASKSRKVNLRALGKRAVGLATEGRWQEAVDVNTQIIEHSPEVPAAHNRLGKALMELGQYIEAQAAFSSSLEVSPTNSIAKKNLQRLEHLMESGPSRQSTQPKIAPQQFIEETGKTGITDLIAPGPPEIRALLGAGELIVLRQEDKNLIADSSNGEYLGQVEPRLAYRLLQLIEGGNRYEGAITSVVDDKISVIIREVYQDPSQADKVSFPSKGADDFRSYVKGSIIKYELGKEETYQDGEPDSWEDKEDEKVPEGISIVTGDRDNLSSGVDQEEDEN